MRRQNRTTLSTGRRTTLRLATVAAAVTAATGMAAASTSAASGDISATATNPYGWAYFNADTNMLAIHDSHADGYGIEVTNYRSDLTPEGPYRGWNRDGNDSTTYYQLHMPYGAEISFYVCAEKGGLIVGSTCGQTAHGYAGPQI
ncbi:hypothetical protein [Streptomyces sp. NBC_01477]|uniref:hypothetical protein n=1 Tax=Streptomyces sp. NBC_01477 TaxID=2976015 RepID=UPI002E33E183|nr:hypothetical protein [Streptomyces sp. NBC_01477]